MITVVKDVTGIHFDQSWVPDGMTYDEVDWQATIDQDSIMLITDGYGSYVFLEQMIPEMVEAHISVSTRLPHGLNSYDIGNAFLLYIKDNVSAEMICAKTMERKTRLYLRHLGFSEMGRDNRFTYFGLRF